RRELEASWRRAWDDLAQLAARTREAKDKLYPAWTDDRWRDWKPRLERPRVVPFGSVAVDAGRAAAVEAGALPFELPHEPIALPALIDMPVAGSVVWQFGRDGRDEAVAGIQAVVARLLTALPPGQV